MGLFFVGAADGGRSVAASGQVAADLARGELGLAFIFYS
jgi:hypothetical protein